MSSDEASLRLLNMRSGTTVAASVRVARSPRERLLGLLRSPPLKLSEALWIEPCNGVHTLGMVYAIAVVTLDDARRVVGLRPHVKPYRLMMPVRAGSVTVEMLTETLLMSDVRMGDELLLVSDVGGRQAPERR